MVTLRTFANPTEAGIAKSLLDSHNIFCRLIDEDVNRYGGAPFAMPIRLQVAEDQAEEAEQILETKGPELPEDFDVGQDPSLEKEPGEVKDKILKEVRGLHHTNQLILLVGVVVLILAVYLVYEIPRHTSPWSPVYEAMRHYDYDRALILTKKIVQQHPDDYYGHEYLGHIYLQMGNLNQAEAEYSRAFQLAPPESLREKLRDVRERIERRSHPRASATPSPWP
jgi:tetratricopeptide (TPR) repeat protein